MKGSTKIFSDCAVVVSPTAEQLAEIAMHAAKNGERFLQQERPRIAMLSFSSQGSSTAIEAQIVQEALGIIHGNTTQNGIHDRGYVYDGELQLDAAIVPHVAASKAPDSPLSGTANVLIFPNLGAVKERITRNRYTLAKPPQLNKSYKTNVRKLKSKSKRRLKVFKKI